MRTRTAVSFTCACLLAPLTGCGAFFFSADFESQRSVSVPHVAETPLDVETENGSVSVVAADGDAVRIDAAIRANTQERADAAEIVADRAADGTLKVRVKWPDGERRNNEGCDFMIAIPDAQGVKIRSSNGRLEVTDLAGAADLRTSNGGIEITGHDGPIDAGSSNGRIIVSGATGRVTASTSNGKITVSLAAGAEGPVELDSSNGAIDLDVGPGFKGELSLSTSNGSLNVDGLSGAEFRRSGKNEGVIVFGDGPGSKIETSNGSIRVSRRAAAD